MRPRLHRPLGDLGVEEGVVHVDDRVMRALVGVLGRVDRRDDLPLEVREGHVLGRWALGAGEAGPDEEERRDEDTGQGSVHGAPPTTAWPASAIWARFGWLDDGECSTCSVGWERDAAPTAVPPGSPRRGRAPFHGGRPAETQLKRVGPLLELLDLGEQRGDVRRVGPGDAGGSEPRRGGSSRSRPRPGAGAGRPGPAGPAPPSSRGDSRHQGYAGPRRSCRPRISARSAAARLAAAPRRRVPAPC